MKNWLSLGLLLLALAQTAHADVYLLDSDSIATKSASKSALATPLPAKMNGRERHGLPIIRYSVQATGSGKLIDNSGVQYFVNTNITFSTTSSASGAMSEASYTHAVAATTSAGGTAASTLNDAFDGYNTLCISPSGTLGSCRTGGAAQPAAAHAVNDFVIYNKNSAAPTSECPDTTSLNRQLVFPQQTIGTLLVSRKVYIPADDSFGRWLNIVTNTGGSAVTFAVDTGNNLGSDNNTRITASASDPTGVAAVTTADDWVTTFQNYSGNTSSDPRLGHVLQGPNAATPVAGISFVNGDDNPWWGYTVTLQPGETKILMNFVVVQPSKAASAAKAAALTALPPTSLECLTAAEKAQISNFAVIPPDLSITKTGAASVDVNANLTYTLAVNNTGGSASSLSVSDTLPSNATFVSATGTGWTCANATGTVTCTLPTLAAGTVATPTAANPITIVVTAPATIGSLSNQATVSEAETDGNPSDNTSAAVVTQVVSPALLSGTKTVAGGNTIGSTGAYTIVLSNSGAAAQLDNPGNEFSDVLPANLTLVSASATSGTAVATVGTRTVTWNGSIPAAGSVTITINFSIASGSAGTVVSNQGTISYDAAGTGTNSATALTDDPAKAGAADPTTFTIGGGAIVSGSKTVIGATAPGGAGTYTIVLHNTGTQPQLDNAGNEFTDVVPANLSVTSATATAGTATATGNTVAWNGSIAAGGSVTITIGFSIVSGTAGAVVSNQGTINYDADGNGTNESTAFTSDPGQPGVSPTVFTLTQATTDVGLSFSPSSVSGPPGSTLSLAAVVTNAGPANAQNVVLTVTFPGSFSTPTAATVVGSGHGHAVSAAAITAGGGGFTCAVAGAVVTCTSPSLASGSFPVTLTFGVPAAAAGYTITGTLTASNDSTPGNNAASAAVGVFEPMVSAPGPGIPALTLLAILLGGLGFTVLRARTR